MKIKNIYLIAVAVAVTTSSTFGAIINVNYQRGTSNTLDGTTYVDSSTSMVSYTGTKWTDINSTNSTITALSDSDGNVTAVSVATAGFDANAHTSQTNPPTLTKGYTYLNNGSGTLTISGLTATSTYDLYLAGQGDQFNQNVKFTLNGTEKSVTEPTAWSTSYGSEGDLYVSYTALTGVSSLVVSVDRQTGSQYAGLNGFQLVETPAVPEPSSAALLGLGALALMGRRKR